MKSFIFLTIFFASNCFAAVSHYSCINTEMPSEEYALKVTTSDNPSLYGNFKLSRYSVNFSILQSYNYFSRDREASKIKSLEHINDAENRNFLVFESSSEEPAYLCPYVSCPSRTSQQLNIETSLRDGEEFGLMRLLILESDRIGTGKKEDAVLECSKREI